MLVLVFVVSFIRIVSLLLFFFMLILIFRFLVVILIIIFFVVVVFVLVLRVSLLRLLLLIVVLFVLLVVWILVLLFFCSLLILVVVVFRVFGFGFKFIDYWGILIMVMIWILFERWMSRYGIDGIWLRFGGGGLGVIWGYVDICLEWVRNLWEWSGWFEVGCIGWEWDFYFWYL